MVFYIFIICYWDIFDIFFVISHSYGKQWQIDFFTNCMEKWKFKLHKEKTMISSNPNNIII